MAKWYFKFSNKPNKDTVKIFKGKPTKELIDKHRKGEIILAYNFDNIKNLKEHLDEIGIKPQQRRYVNRSKEKLKFIEGEIDRLEQEYVLYPSESYDISNELEKMIKKRDKMKSFFRSIEKDLK